MDTTNARKAWAFTLYVQADSGEYLDCADDLMRIGQRIPTFTPDGGWVDGSASHPLKFLYWQEEMCPTTHRLHFQGGFSTKKSHRFSGIKKMMDNWGLTTMHFEPAHDPEGRFNRLYCQKKETALAGTQMEFGIQPWQRHKVEQEHLILCLKAGMSGDVLATKYPDAHLRYGRQYELTYGAMKRADSLAKPKRDHVGVHVRWGESGCGKTRGIKVVYGEDNCYVWNYEEKYQSYKGEPVVIFDDFDGSQIKINHMKLICQFEKYLVSSKGEKAVEANWSEVFITSQHPPETYYYQENAADIKAFMRRLTSVTRFQVPYGDPAWEAARGA